MESLAGLLREESALLLGREPLRLEQLLEAKALRVSELASLDQRREDFFARLGLDRDPQAAADQLDERFPETGMGELWRRLTALAEECRRLNRLNGAAVRLGQHHLGQALRILRGESAATDLYRPDGSTAEPDGHRRLLGQA